MSKECTLSSLSEADISLAKVTNNICNYNKNKLSTFFWLSKCGKVEGQHK